MQRWPAHPDMEAAASFAAISAWASGKTIRWFLAPPKAVHLFRFDAARLYTILATFVDPTKDTALIPGWSQMFSTMPRSPFTMLNTPSGRPASFNISAIRFAVIGTISEGFRIMQFPKARAFGSVQCGTMCGKLKGEIDATTPSGFCSTRHSTPGLTSSTSPCTSCGSEQANSVSSMLFATSAVASPIVFPFSSWTMAASSFRFCSINVL